MNFNSKKVKIDQTTRIKKYSPFVIGGIALSIFLILFDEFFREAFSKKFGDFSSVALSIVAAYLAEKKAQSIAGVNLTWARFDTGKATNFFIYFVAWTAFLVLSWPSLLESSSLFEYLIDMMVVYMFAGAFFEIFNILKKESSK